MKRARRVRKPERPVGSALRFRTSSATRQGGSTSPGAAAVGLPVLAGALFDRTGSHASTVWVAAGINVLGMLVAGRLPAR